MNAENEFGFCQFPFFVRTDLYFTNTLKDKRRCLRLPSQKENEVVRTDFSINLFPIFLEDVTLHDKTMTGCQRRIFHLS